MVQLKHETSVDIANYTVVFQFHNGTIKTEWFQSHPIMDFRFQFHNGTIKTHRHL